MKTKLRSWMAAIICATAVVSSGNAASFFDFESGDFTGWEVLVPTYETEEYGPQVAGGAYVKNLGTSWWSYPPYDPVNGDYLAELVIDNSALGRGGYVAVQRTFTLQAGDTISGWAAFTTEDELETDRAFTKILDQFGTMISTPWSASSGFEGFSETGLPWTYWNWTSSSSGDFTLELRIETRSDAQMGSSALFDAISVSSVAVPDNSSTLVLLLSSLAMVGCIQVAHWIRSDRP